MNAAQKKLLGRAFKHAPYLRPLNKSLLALGGHLVVLWNGNNGIYTVKGLLDNGRSFDISGLTLQEMEPSQCHSNVFDLCSKDPSARVLTGYGLSDDGVWRPHSWCIKDGQIIETTVPRVAYFGVAPSLEMCRDWLSNDHTNLQGHFGIVYDDLIRAF